ALSPDGRELYVSGADAGALAIFRRDSDGTLACVHAGDVPVPTCRVDVAPGARGLLASGDGHQLYATALGDSSLTTFARQLGSACGVTGDGQTLADTLDLSPGGSVTYTLTGHLDPGATGTLTNTASVQAGPGVVIDSNLADDA